MPNTEFAVLVLPGLLEPPPEVRADLRAPALSALLARAMVQASGGYAFEAVLGEVFDYFDLGTGMPPVAALEWPLRFSTPPPPACLRADPVHLQVDRDCARLLEGAVLQLRECEARALATSLNEHFAEDGIQFHFAAAQQWFMTAGRSLDVDMSSPSYAAGRNVQHFAPSGESAIYWNAFLTEVQMLLHAHPVNRHRQAQGQYAVNSLWLWGGGELQACGTRSHGGRVYADDTLTRAIAEHTLHETSSLPIPQAPLQITTAFILADDVLSAPAVCGDAAEWRSAFERVESLYLDPVLTALGRARITGVQLYPCAGQRIDAHRADGRKFWRKRKLLRDYLLTGH